MSMKCIICSHNNKLEIDRALAGGRSMASIGRQYGVSVAALTNHRDNHLTRQLVTAVRKKEAMESMDILTEVESLIRSTKKILKEAESKHNYGLALKAIAEARGSYELLCKIAVALHDTRRDELDAEAVYHEQAQKADLQKSLECLTLPEAIMFRDLAMKINKQDKSIIVIPEKPDEYANVSSGINNDTSNESSPVPAVKGKSDIIGLTRGKKPGEVLKTALNQVSTNSVELKEATTDDSDMPSWYVPGNKYEWVNGRPLRPARPDERIPRRAGGDTSVSDFLRDRGVIR